MTTKEKLEDLELLAQALNCSPAKAAYITLCDYYDGSGMGDCPFQAMFDTMTEEQLIAEYLKICP